MFLQVLKNYVSMIRSGPEYFALAFEPGLARAREVLQNLGFALLPKRCNYLHATKVESYRRVWKTSAAEELEVFFLPY